MPVTQRHPLRAALSAALLLALAPTGSEAAPRRPATPAAALERPETAWTSGEAQAPQCSQSRRKLWQAGEGWVVKTVQVCR